MARLTVEQDRLLQEALTLFPPLGMHRHFNLFALANYVRAEPEDVAARISDFFDIGQWEALWQPHLDGALEVEPFDLPASVREAAATPLSCGTPSAGRPAEVEGPQAAAGWVTYSKLVQPGGSRGGQEARLRARRALDWDADEAELAAR